MLEDKRRLFIGIELDAASRTRCCAVAEALRASGFAARYGSAAKLHVTLAFLGNIEPARYLAVAAALAEIAAGRSSLSLRLDKAGAFPNERRPRVVYVGSRAQGEEYRSLATAVRGTYARLGFRFKEDPVAHVTIARVKDVLRPLPPIEVAPFALAVRAISLFESIFDAKANSSRYEILQRSPVGAIGARANAI